MDALQQNLVDVTTDIHAKLTALEKKIQNITGNNTESDTTADIKHLLEEFVAINYYKLLKKSNNSNRLNDKADIRQCHRMGRVIKFNFKIWKEEIKFGQKSQA
ncbi:unnamed protein product [Leptidea sinapis]|uniref:Uncharacterized protein n=1 Tax=Leptidea sinapis TaxID=189913 RepID=A0A5E4QED6_9NEOP|nr:unnamed protein product [Leptidea sinapis]